MDEKISYGDYVEVSTGKRAFEGVFLEVPESENGIVLLKLDNGYNVGIKKKEITKIEIIEKRKDEVKEELILSLSEKKQNVGLIILGGTIASRYDSKTGGVSWLSNKEEFFKFYPEIFEVCNVSRVEVPFMKGSENMDSIDWKKIARTVKEFLEDKSLTGVIITQGTDTLQYTSSALSFFLRNPNKPVVLTYSQRSIDRASSDANLNLRCSAIMAISNIAEVMVVGHSSTEDDFCYAHYATRVRKLHSSKRDAFKSINSFPIAKVFLDRFELISNDYNLKQIKSKFSMDNSFEDKIALLKFYPGQDPDILNYYLEKEYKGIVIEMFGLGHLATSESRKSWISKLKELDQKGVVVCATAQTVNGRLNPLVYSTGRELLQTGIIYLEDMLSETAFVKLGWVLGHEEWAKNKEIIKEKMLTSFSHELSSISNVELNQN